MSTRFQKLSSAVLASLLVTTVIAGPLAAQRRGGGGFRGGGGGFRGGGGGFRASARPSVSRPSGGFRTGSAGGTLAPRPSNPIAGNRPVNRPGNIGNRPGNGNIINNRPINGDINVGGGWDDHYHGCCYRGGVAAGYVAGVATAAAVGSAVYALPSNCVATVVNGVTYQQCGSTWYMPQFNGTATTYVAVSPP